MWNNIEVCHQTQYVSRGIGKSELLCCGQSQVTETLILLYREPVISNPILTQASLRTVG